MKLRAYYFLLAFCIVIPVAICCTIALNMLRHSERDSAIQRIHDSARLKAMMIDSDIERAKAVLLVLANSQALAEGDRERFHDEARRASAGEGAWIILYDETGQQLINTRHPFGGALPKRPDPEQVTKLLASDGTNVSGMRWGAALKSNFVMVERAIRSRSGQRYVIGQAFSPRFFSHSIVNDAIPASWLVAIFDVNGVFISRRYEPEKFVGKKIAPVTRAAFSASNSGTLPSTALDGNPLYNVFTRSAQSGWTIAIGAPVKELEEAVWNGVGVIAAGLLIAMLCTLTLVMMTGRHLLAFIHRTSFAARSLGRGDMVTTLPPSVINELDELNVAIMDASRRLQAEMRSRADAEADRNTLLVLEKNARAKAEQQNSAKDEFLAMLGHELRNPLSAVTSAVSILDSGRPLTDGVIQRTHAVLRRQTDHLRKLVDDLLEVNRALMGKLTLDKTPTDLAAVTQRSVEALQSGGRTDGFEWRVATEPATVFADPTRLLQVIDNILDNAIKYSPAGGLIHVSVRSIDGHAELEVRDSGIGINPELLPSVFDVFVQGAQTLQRAQGGLGIGLSLVRRLVGMHEGSVTISSAGAGMGCVVTVRLPLMPVDAAAPAAAAVAVPTARTVLLVEDNHDAREMMAMLLELRSCSVYPAENGPDGIALALAHQPEIALVDIGLADMDGYAVARALKGDPLTAHIVLVALTGYGSREDRQRASEAGFDHHFTKPIKLEDLDAVLA
ncbi:MAG TPA: ATP-binding protein [Telluria sp.]